MGEVSVWVGENFFANSGDGCTTLMNAFNPTKLHT